MRFRPQMTLSRRLGYRPLTAASSLPASAFQLRRRRPDAGRVANSDAGRGRKQYSPVPHPRRSGRGRSPVNPSTHPPQDSLWPEKCIRRMLQPVLPQKSGCRSQTRCLTANCCAFNRFLRQSRASRRNASRPGKRARVKSRRPGPSRPGGARPCFPGDHAPDLRPLHPGLPAHRQRDDGPHSAVRWLIGVIDSRRKPTGDKGLESPTSCV